MWRHTKQLMILTGWSLVVWMVPVSVPVWAGVDVNINIGVPLPPAIVVEAPPAMVFLAEPGVYVAVGVPYDIFFIGDHYYYAHGGYWYWAPGYGGPWVHVVDQSLPSGLRRYKVDRLHEFREREFQRYREDGPKYRGKHFNAVAGPGPKVRDEMKRGPMEPGKGKHERGRGKHER